MRAALSGPVLRKRDVERWARQVETDEGGAENAVVQGARWGKSWAKTDTLTIFNAGTEAFKDDRLDDALECYDEVTRHRPDDAFAWRCLGDVLREMKRLPAAIAAYDRSAEIKNDPVTSWHAGMAYLAAGQYERGWELYESRWGVYGAQQPLNLPGKRWNGESLKGKSILLWAEQGYGDTIQFCRYAKDVVALEADVTLEVQGPLVKLMKVLSNKNPQSPEWISVIKRGDIYDHEIEYNCPLMSLPGLLQNASRETFHPYLMAVKNDQLRMPAVPGEDTNPLHKLHGKLHPASLYLCPETDRFSPKDYLPFIHQLVDEEGKNTTRELPRMRGGARGKTSSRLQQSAPSGMAVPGMPYESSRINPGHSSFKSGTESEKTGSNFATRVGICWFGNRPWREKHRSIPPSLLEPIINAGVNFVALHPKLRQIDVDTPCIVERVEFIGGLRDFADTAELIRKLDLIITVDTAVAHLAGAMGKPVWILIPYIGTCWRWGVESETTHWYPTARLFRQGADMRWEPVIERVAKELEGLNA